VRPPTTRECKAAAAGQSEMGLGDAYFFFVLDPASWWCVVARPPTLFRILLPMLEGEAFCVFFNAPPPVGGRGQLANSKLTRPMRSERGGAGEKPAEWYLVLLRSMSSWRVASLSVSGVGGLREVRLRRGHGRQRGRRSRGGSGGALARRGAASSRCIRRGHGSRFSLTAKALPGLRVNPPFLTWVTRR